MKPTYIRSAILTLAGAVLTFDSGFVEAQEGIRVGKFEQEVSDQFGVADGLPSSNISGIAIDSTGIVYAATDSGLGVFVDGEWSSHPEVAGSPIRALISGDTVFGIHEGAVVALTPSSRTKIANLPEGIDPDAGFARMFDNRNGLVLATREGLHYLHQQESRWEWSKDLTVPPELSDVPVVGIALAPEAGDQPSTRVVATSTGLFRITPKDPLRWIPQFPWEGTRSWAPRDVRAAAYGSDGRLWFASPQGVGVQDSSGEWKLYAGRDGLPYNDFSSIATAPDGSVWFGTTKGAIHFDGEHWAYRQGLRWLPDDDVRDIAVSTEGDAWFATANGVGRIRRVPMTLAEKAAYYESEIDKYNRRTPYEYVLEARLAAPGDKSSHQNHDSDNDGLWTAMYGAGECFAYAATGDLKAKARAQMAYRALEFLGAVTQGGEHAPDPGYVARTILPASGADPNVGRLERDRRERDEGDALWKVFDPRWPLSADGEWYWKGDTSSDELDGHFFFYGLYYDLVAETDEEKERVRAHVKALTDHLVSHGFNLVDHDGQPTRWARFGPEELNFDRRWFVERGLNSLSILSYLYTAAHVTGENRYIEMAKVLIEEHGYAQNIFYPKLQRGIGTGNQSDDEMAFMCYYALLKYAEDDDLLEGASASFWHYWRLEGPELNPFFNFAFAASIAGKSYAGARGRAALESGYEWLDESIDTLKRFPLDRADWRHTNSHRIDIVPLQEWRGASGQGAPGAKGLRVNGKVLPVDERHFNHWNADPFRLDTGGNGQGLADGAVFLLPYYMGLYHGYIVE